jgi:hypothetical protein
MRRMTRTGRQVPASRVHTYALRSCEQDTIRLVFGAQSMPVTTESCSFRTVSGWKPVPLFDQMWISLLFGQNAISVMRRRESH